MGCVHFAVLLCLCVPVAHQAQSTATQGNSAQEVTAGPRPSDRIIDVAAAQRAKQREHSFHLREVPLLPFHLLGRGMGSGLLSVKRHHLMDKARYYLAERDRGFAPLLGRMGGGAGAGSGISLNANRFAIGTGFAAGLKYYDNNFLRRGGRLEIPLRVSSLLYQEYGVGIGLPLDSGRRVFFDSSVYYRVRTQDDFFGLGNHSLVTDRTSYMLQTREVLFGPRFEFGHGVRLATQFGYRGANVFDGEDRKYPVITRRFARSTIPGLLDGAREWLGGAELVHDGRDVPGRPRRGGLHRVLAAWFGSADSNDFGFWRYEVEAERYFPLGGRNRTLALRFLGITNQARGGSAVPFFEQAILGGSFTMRGFREFRFYDRSAMLATAEYRYNLNSFMDILLFMDQGQVARQPGDFSWNGLRTGYGFGVRFLSAQSTPFKIIIGRSNEGTRIYFSMGATF